MTTEFVVHHGDCLDVLPTLAPQSIDAVVTSPPYAEQRKGTYGGVPEKEYPAWTVAWMDALRPALKPDASVIINIRPHVRGGVISDYVLRTRLALRDAGWAEIEELIWYKTKAAPMGHTRRPRRSWESLLWYALHGRPHVDPYAGGTVSAHGFKMRGGAAQRNGWTREFRMGRQVEKPPGSVARVRDVVAMASDNSFNLKHPATYPPGLPLWCMNLVCPPGGTVLDPFSGIASTGVAALQSGRSYVGVEAMGEYVEASRARLASVPMPLPEAVEA